MSTRDGIGYSDDTTMFNVDGSTTTNASQRLEGASALVAEPRPPEATSTTAPNQNAPYASTTPAQMTSRSMISTEVRRTPPTTIASSENRITNAMTRPARTA